MKFITFFLFLTFNAVSVASVAAEAEGSRQAASVGARTAESVARDQYRHPYQTLNFFQVGGNQTVLEIWPGAGWYTEILAPTITGGTYYAAHFPKNSGNKFFDRSLASFKEKMVSSAAYADVKVVEFSPENGVLSVPVASVDRVVTFRNVHNWLRTGSEQAAFDLFYRVLKPGGLLGVVEHRARKDISRQEMLESGYMTQRSVITLAVSAGFEMLARSEINANVKDSTQHPKGVWTLPPSLRLQALDRDKYLAIGESDRMTLLFIKPE